MTISKFYLIISFKDSKNLLKSKNSKNKISINKNYPNKTNRMKFNYPQHSFLVIFFYKKTSESFYPLFNFGPNLIPFSPSESAFNKPFLKSE